MTAPDARSAGWIDVSLRAACLLAFLAFSLHAFLWIPRLTYGFAMYYTYARLVVQGETLDRAYDAAYFNGKVHEFGFDLQDEPNNLPTSALAYIPVAWLAPVAAKIVWSCISLLCLAGALKVLLEVSSLRATGRAGLGLMTLVFLWRPAWDTLAYGQVYFLLLLLFALFLKGVVLGRPAAAGIPLALALLAKGYGVIPALLVALRRRWKVAAICAGGVIGVAAATIPLLGERAWPAFSSHVLSTLGTHPYDAHVAYQTINSLIRHLFVYDPLWLPHPALPLPGIAVTLLSYGASAAVVLMVLFRSPRGEGREALVAYGAAVAAGVVTAPLAEEYHYVLFLPLIFGLVAEFADRVRVGERWGSVLLVPAAAVFVMAAPINTRPLQEASFPLIVLAYPKLYAGLAILWFSCRTSAHDRTPGKVEARYVAHRAHTSKRSSETGVERSNAS